MTNDQKTTAADLRRWEVRYHDPSWGRWSTHGSYVTKREARIARDYFCSRHLGSKPKTWIVDLWERMDGTISDPRRESANADDVEMIPQPHGGALLPPPKDRAPEPEGECELCSGSGWECYGLGKGDPHHRICERCGNPDDLPAP